MINEQFPIHLINKNNNINDLNTSIVVIDSRNRDYNKYPNANDYVIKLSTEYKRVHEIELLYSMIPRSQYLINDNNNRIYLNFNENNFIIPISNGNYEQDNDSSSSLLSSNSMPIKSFISQNLDYKINTTLNKYNSIKNYIQCLYNYNTKKYYFYNSNHSSNNFLSSTNILDFSLDFKGNLLKISNIEHGNEYILEEKQLYKENSIGNILGFNPVPNSLRNGPIYTNSEKKSINFIFKNYGNNKAEITLNLSDISQFNKLLYCITTDNPLLSRLMISNTSDFSYDRDIINFNVNTTYPPDLIYKNVYYHNYTLNSTGDIVININQNANNDNWNLKSINKNTNEIIIESNNYSGGLANENSNNIYIRFTFIESDNLANLEGESYLLLDIDEMHRLESNNSNIQDSYELITLTANQQIFEHSKAYGNVKIFNPIINKLNKLHLSFKNNDGIKYNFNGQDHVLVFAITYNTKQII